MTAPRDTANLRAATGLDQGARPLMLNVVWQLAGLGTRGTIGALFLDRYGSVTDYLAAVLDVRGEQFAFLLRREVERAQLEAEFPAGLTMPGDPSDAAADALLMNMPEADFLLAIESAVFHAKKGTSAAARLNRICQTRGAPWTFSVTEGFQWIGDSEVQRELVIPALAAINDPRFSGGVRSEFETARSELRHGTPQARKQAIHEAGCAVESAMKVVLDQRGIAYPPRATAKPLFDQLTTTELVPAWLEQLVLGAATPRNRSGGHGAGAVAHQPSQADAEAVVASAAGAIAYLGKLLP